jgi:hypothetical protein
VDGWGPRPHARLEGSMGISHSVLYVLEVSGIDAVVQWGACEHTPVLEGQLVKGGLCLHADVQASGRICHREPKLRIREEDVSLKR